LQVKKRDFGDCINHASVTPKNTEYTKYDLPGAQVSDDALTQKYLLYTPPSYPWAYFFTSAAMDKFSPKLFWHCVLQVIGLTGFN
jgi:hypothetical protein